MASRSHRRAWAYLRRIRSRFDVALLQEAGQSRRLGAGSVEMDSLEAEAIRMVGMRCDLDGGRGISHEVTRACRGREPDGITRKRGCAIGVAPSRSGSPAQRPPERKARMSTTLRPRPRMAASARGGPLSAEAFGDDGAYGPWVAS